MKKNNLVLFFLLLISTSDTLAQHVSFPDDKIERGYFTRTYKRYEAEIRKCQTNGNILIPTYNQTAIQSEASNQVATQLINKDSYIKWINDEAADGLTIRFSLPDGPNGEGTTGTLALYVNDEYIQDLTLNSFWAWQYTLISGSNKYPDNTPSTTKFARMRFDEMHWKLNNKIPTGATFKLVKKDDNTTPYTIDFVELEPVPAPVTYESITDENKVMYDASVSLVSFIDNNGGKTIYIPAGIYDVSNRILIRYDNTKLIGAGMWYTQIYFSASSDDITTYSRRGIHSNNNGIVVDGLYLNTVNNKRYYLNNSSYQVGKGFMGGWGSNSVIRNVWVDHFECGAWIADYDGLVSNNLLVEHCRFRNNYADGLNLCAGVNNAIVQYCSFRNNGDDDMASWSASNQMCINNTFQYNTAENNWRASSLGFFGGQQNKAFNCVIIDPMEAGLRATCDFPGPGFGTTGYNEFRNISIYKGGVAAGAVGTSGDFWGNQQGAIHLNSSSNYNLLNIRLENIDLYNSKYNAVYLSSGSTTNIQNLQLNNINIAGTGNYGLYFINTKGNGTYCNITYNNIGASTNSNSIPSFFTFSQNCTSALVEKTENPEIDLYSNHGTLTVSGVINTTITLYNAQGIICSKTGYISDKAYFENLVPGIYFVRLNNKLATYKVIVK